MKSMKPKRNSPNIRSSLNSGFVPRRGWPIRLVKKMRRLLQLLLFGLIFESSLDAGQQKKDDAEIAALTKQLVEAATADSGVDQAIQDISSKFSGFDHEKVIDALIPLLKHDKDGVADKASYVILDYTDGLRPVHLAQLKEGFRNGGGWLPTAIASLGTDEAAEFLAKEFRADPEIHGQMDWALIRMGEKAVPFLLKEFDDADPEREQRYFEGLRHIFKGDNFYDGMKEKAKSAIPHLMKIAESKDVDLRLRQEAIKTVGCVGKAAASIFPRLRTLAEEEPDKFDEAVTQAIIASETSAAAEIFANKVEAGADHYMVREIALLGTEAIGVGPRVLRWLNHPSWEMRVMATRTLGAIGYKDAVTELEKLLSSKDDWRLPYAAAKSLAELRAVESTPALEELSREHWFPIVRDAAKEALRCLQHGGAIEGHGATKAGDLVDYDFIDRNKLSIKAGDLRDLKPRTRGAGRQTSFEDFKDREPNLAKKLDEIRNKNGEGMLGGIGSIIEFPIDGGMLLGRTAGEWVGGLYHVSEKGEHRLLLQKNITGIEKWNGSIFVASGINHMGLNKGIIHRIVEKDGKVAVLPWFVLPGMPTSMWVTEDEKLIVACMGGTLAFSDEGEFHYYGSEPSKPKNSKQSDGGQPATGPDSR